MTYVLTIDIFRWICIYPAYINKNKTLAEGRRLPKEQCIDNPTPHEMRDVLSAAGFKIGVENKLYSRERSKEMSARGRIRVQLKNDDGSLYHPSYPKRESIMLHLTEMIPKLKSRQMKQEQTQAQPVTGGGKGKKGKGRR